MLTVHRDFCVFEVNLSVEGGAWAGAEHDGETERQRQAQSSLSGGGGHSDTRRNTKHEVYCN